mgnify:CR=1 FL=1
MSSAPVLIAGKKTGLSMRKQVTWIQTLAVLVLLAACPAQARTAAIAEPETLLRAQEQLTPWFNLSIAVFSRETRREKNRIYDQINDVETRYLPTVLRNTLIESGHWGAVKVGPVPDISAELQVTGRILESTALVLTLHVEARDSRGVAWINRDYSAPAHTATYEQDRSMRVDPFQPLSITRLPMTSTGRETGYSRPKLPRWCGRRCCVTPMPWRRRPLAAISRWMPKASSR